MSEWISVNDRYPDVKQVCLLYTPCDGLVCVGYYNGKGRSDNRHKWKLITAMRSTQTLTKKVSHWMPIPQIPDET